MDRDERRAVDHPHRPTSDVNGNGTIDFSGRAGQRAGAQRHHRRGRRANHRLAVGRMHERDRAAERSRSMGPAVRSRSSVDRRGGCGWGAASTAELDYRAVAARAARAPARSSSEWRQPAAGSRSGTVTIAGQTFTVTQEQRLQLLDCVVQRDGCGGGGTGSVAVTTGAGCGWTASELGRVADHHGRCERHRQRHRAVLARPRRPAVHARATLTMAGRRSRSTRAAVAASRLRPAGASFPPPGAPAPSR